MWAEVKAKFRTETVEEIVEEVQECLEMEAEIPPVHQEWETLSLVEDEVSAIKIAEEYFHKKNVIIPFKVHRENKTEENLLKRKEEILSTMDAFQKTKGVIKRSSKFIGCKCCGSSMARTYFKEREHTCKICGNNLWSETNQKIWNRYFDSLEKINKKLEKCRDTYDVICYVQASLITK